MIRAIYLKNGESSTETRVENLPAILAKNPTLLWVDIVIENNSFTNEEISLLTETFKFHELSIEDCLFPQYHPKIEEFENYVFAAIHGVRVKAKDLSDFEDAIYEVDIFIGKNFLITVHSGEILFIDSMFEKAKLKPQVELKSLENLLYNIFQRIIVSFESALDKIGDRFDQLEDKLLENPTKETMQELFSIKKVLLNFRKISEPQQNVYIYFTRETLGFITKEQTAYFRDIFFQFVRINQSLSSHNQMIGSMLEVYVSGVTLKLNEVIKFLTVIATIFLPALLITSYYGMNVLPFAEHRIFGNENVWYFAFFMIVLTTFLTYLFIKRKKWF
ncbi:MAG: magnesium transporter CorA family protein [Elusimicrobia bacterium]|nr:magnesium transporter CorA family protein [Elusimicrobiota bacterium]